ncbi:MAG: phage portal protein [Stellaceae bacterium]
MADPKKPNMLTRLGIALDMVRGKPVDYSTWFGPLDPLTPTAPEEIKGRRFDLPMGFNINTSPRGIDGTGYARPSFPQLRALAENYDLMRLVIETRKDQLVKMKWLIQSRDADQRKDDKSDPRIKQVTEFFQMPDRERDWQTWLRAMVEDVLVIDAVAIYPRRTNGGQLYALELIDGATIKPVIDDFGRRPLPPDVAYQEVLKGLPAIDYGADELFYFQRNPRTDRVYGFSPVEQVMMTVNIGIRRQLHQLEFYTSGTVPDMLIPVPENWSPDQIEQFQHYWDALLSDNTAERRRVRFVPPGIGKGAVQTKEAALKDDYDEWLARIVCYAF